MVTLIWYNGFMETERKAACAERWITLVVKWLHEKRAEGCTTQAMDIATSEGHLGVVQRLHAYRTEGCTKLTSFSVSLRGNYAVARWMIERNFVTVEAIRRDLSEQVALIDG